MPDSLKASIPERDVNEAGWYVPLAGVEHPVQSQASVLMLMRCGLK